MSFYNYFNGINPHYKAILLSLGLWSKNLPKINADLPMLDRFRDVFYKDGLVKVYCRLGSGNRKEYKKEIKIARKNKYFEKDYDSSCEETYIVFIFKKFIITPNYYREVFFDTNKALADFKRNKVITTILQKVLEGEKLTVKEMLQNPHLIKKITKKDGDMLTMLDREDIINVIEAQTNYDKILRKYNDGGFIVYNN